MNTSYRSVMLTLLALTFCRPAIPQQAVLPPPKPTDSGPSLAATMQFLQEKLNDIGKVSYVMFIHNTTTEEDFTATKTDEVTNVTADPNKCQIAYPYTNSEVGDGFLLRDVQDVVIEPFVQYLNDVMAAAGNPNLIASSTNPPLTALLVYRPHGVVNYLPFTDPQLADRVAKAMTHAVELCGGGNKDPF
jgi:hypothetical protein